MKLFFTSLSVLIAGICFGQNVMSVSNLAGKSNCDYEITFYAQDNSNNCFEISGSRIYNSGDINDYSFPSAYEITYVKICDKNNPTCCMGFEVPSSCVHCTSSYGPASSSFAGVFCGGCSIVINLSCTELSIEDL